MNLSLRQLYHFAIIADLRSFTRAAERLGITQPALSRSIAAIEDRYGVRLFDRDRSGVWLTTAGQALERDARLLLAEARAIEQNLTLAGAGEGGSVTFGTGPLIGSLVLPRLLADVAAADTRLTVSAMIKGLEELPEQVAAGDLEFALLARPLPRMAELVRLERIGSFRLGLFCRSDHPLTKLPSASFEAFGRFPIACGSSSEFPEALKPAIVCDNFHILRDVMLDSDAVWLTADRLLERELASGLAVEIDAPWAVSLRDSIDIVLARPIHRSLSPAARMVSDAVRAILA